MLCVPAVRAAVEQAAVRVLPLPVRATAAQPAIEVPPSVKFTLPVGAFPVTVAVNVTLPPAVDGFAELATVVDDGPAAALITCDNVLLVEALLLVSPP